MTIEKTTPQTLDTEVKNPAALLAKNWELIGTLKALQTELAAAQNALQAEQTKHGDTTARLRQFRTDDPFKAVVRELSPHPGLMEKILRDYLTLDIDADGKAIVLAKDGGPLTWERVERRAGYEDRRTTVQVEMTAESLRDWIGNGLGEVPDSPAALFYQARGTGAPGSGIPSYRTAAPKVEASTGKTAPPAFGLR